MTSWRRQAGLTLVELMIATTLSIVLLAGVLLVFSANKATYQMQNGLGTLQENGRYAASQIASDLQMAGFGGCLSPHLKRVDGGAPRVINVVSSSPPYLTEFIDGTFLVGRNDQSTTVTMGGVTMVTGTDSIEVRGPLRSNVNFVAGAIPADQPVVIVGDASGFAANEYLLIGDCSSATLFRATAVSTSGGN
ncbi:MAG: prepilin-type N-terminal cleavage/methylation domain-containing protein, partial [Gammaproteobacteria bacterium]|nr:prepilin-type N-terminal cleavage/methylation domain-containing protein [Gammaproteobacteria bacterium]